MENFVCPKGFTCPDEALAKAEFWEKLYAVYDENKAVYYDAINPQVTYNIIEGQKCRVRVGRKSVRPVEVQKEFNRIRSVLLSIAAKKAAGKTEWTEDELVILEKASVKEDFNFKLAAKDGEIQCDNGMKNRFFEALQRCPLYQDVFVSELKKANFPEDLQYLALSESLCNPRAGSRVGATGIWQFMPATATIYKLKMNTYMDERRDVIASTNAAMKYIAYATQRVSTHAQKFGFDADFASLSPLVITSYNCGVGGMCNSMVANRDIDYGTVIEEHQGNGFGDAVKNYFSSFLAAYHIATNPQEYYDDNVEPLYYESTQIVRLSRNTKMSTFSEQLNIPMEKLKALNPKFTKTVWAGNPIPAGYTVELPLFGFNGCVEDFGEAIQVFDRRSFNRVERMIPLPISQIIAKEQPDAELVTPKIPLKATVSTQQITEPKRTGLFRKHSSN